MSTIKVNTLTTRSGCTMTLGESGKTIALATGASQTGFGRTGTVDWDTTPKTATFTAVSGDGFFCNTTGGAFTCNLPAGTAGAIVSLADYAGTWQTNNLTVSPNGTDKIGSVNANTILSTEGQSVTLVFVDSTQGWINIQDSTSNVRASAFIVASGGTIVDSGNFRTHIFTSPGNFVVSQASPNAPDNTGDYFIVAGGASGGSGRGGGGGAGGFRMSNALSLPAPTTSPLANPTGVTLSAQTYPIVVGAGGAARPYPTACAGNPGSNSSGFGLTSAGGGGGGSGPARPQADDGGSGGGGNFNVPGASVKGSGNTPPVSPPQGNDGSISCSAAPSSPPDRHGGGGGGAGSAGGPGAHETGGEGSFIDANFIGPTAPSYGSSGPVSATRYFSGGGGAGFEASGSGAGGSGGGGAGNNTSTATAGTTNSGGGGGGVGEQPGTTSGAGGSGIVMIRYRFQ